MSQPEPSIPPASPPQATTSSDWLQAIQPFDLPAREDAAAPELSAEELFLEQLRKLQLEDYRQDIAARKSYANKLFILIAVWLTAIFGLLIASGFGRVGNVAFKLTDGVLLGLIGGTTASVIGLFLVVVNYLFPQRKDKSSG